MKKIGIFVLMLLCTSLHATNYSWSAGGGINTTYTTLTNWSPTPPTGGPGNADVATVGSSYVVGITASTMIPNGVNLTFNDGSKLLRNSVSSVAIGTGTTLNFNNNASMSCSQISLAGTAVFNWNSKGSWTTAGASTAAFFAVTAATANTDVIVNMSDGLWDLSGNSATESFSMQAGTFNMTGGKIVNEDGFKLGSGTTSAIFNFSGNSEFYTSSAFSIFGTNSRFNFGGGNTALYIEGTTVTTTGTGGFAPLYTRINQGLVYIDNVQQKNAAFFDRKVVTVSGKSYVKITALTTPTYKWTGAGATTLYTNTANWDTSVSGGPGAGSTALIGSGFTVELGTAATVAAHITGAGSLIKTQNGITTLSGTNTYTGSTQISAGTILVAGSLTETSFIMVDGGAGLTNLTALPFGQPLILGEGASLAGAGAGITAFSPSSMSVSGDIAYGFATISVQSGGLVKSGQLTLTLTHPVNGSYTLFSGSNVTGTFTSIILNGATLSSLGNGDFTGSAGQATYAFNNTSNLLVVTGAPTTIHPAPLRLKGDGTMLLNGQPFKALGVNYYDSFNRILENPNNKTSFAGLAELSSLGIPCIRFDLSGRYPIYTNLFFTNREEYFRRLDDFVVEAEKRGVGLVPSFFWTPYNVCDIVGEHLDQLAVTNSLTRQKMREFTEAVVTRYKNSPAIWIWELGNEWNIMPDIPNYLDFPPPTDTSKGYPATRDLGTYDQPGRDALSSDILIPVIQEFGTQVKALDPDRPISTGFADPRNCAWHLDQAWRRLIPVGECWTVDTDEQAREIARRHNPAIYDLYSLHVYPASYPDFNKNRQVAVDLGLTLFVGEFGTQVTDEYLFPDMLASVKATAPLALLWNYDRAVSDVAWNVTTSNSRNYMLYALLTGTSTDSKNVEDDGSALKKSGNFILINGHQLSIPHYTAKVVSVYDLAGKLIFNTNKPVFNITTSGLYIVKMGNKVQRICIN